MAATTSPANGKSCAHTSVCPAVVVMMRSPSATSIGCSSRRAVRTSVTPRGYPTVSDRSARARLPGVLSPFGTDPRPPGSRCPTSAVSHADRVRASTRAQAAVVTVSRPVAGTRSQMGSELDLCGTREPFSPQNVLRTSGNQGYSRLLTGSPVTGSCVTALAIRIWRRSNY